MPITSADIIIYGSQVMAEDETTLNIGGAIDLTTTISFIDISSPTTLEFLSDNSGDNTQQLTIVGRDIGGAILTESVALNGQTIVPFVNTYERILKCSLDGVAVGSISVRKTGGASDYITILPGVTTVKRLFYLASADVLGGVQREFHDKIFIKNNHGTLTLTEANIIEQSDPGANVTFDLESTLDGTDTNGGGNNRLVAPVGYTFDSTTKPVENSQNHTAGAAQGIWMKLTLVAGQAPAKNTYTLRESGKTT